MLRFDFMSSDFNEHFLILGSCAELAELAGTLRRYADAPAPIELSACFPNPTTTAKVVLEPAEGNEQGLHVTGEKSFRWGLLGWQAAIIAAGIDKLNADRSGSEIFQLGAEGEIPVKVSHGEYEDEFLVTKY